jgi:hypothetical protein
MARDVIEDMLVDVKRFVGRYSRRWMEDMGKQYKEIVEM